MCVILISVSKKDRPSLSTLLACQASNPHGGGVAWVERGVTHFAKDVDAKFIDDICKTKSGQIVAHFRIATVGGVTPSLCHPFPISRNPSVELRGKAKRVLFHNGTWPEWNAVLSKAIDQSNASLPSGIFSDSRASAVVASLEGTKRLHKFGGKFVVFSKKGAFMYNEGWTKHTDGVWYSNLHWNYRLSSGLKSGESKRWKKTYPYYKGDSLFDQACNILGEQKIEGGQWVDVEDERLDAQYYHNISKPTQRLIGFKSHDQIVGGLHDKN